MHDHPALRAALDSPPSVVPVFCLDDRLLHGRHASGPRTQFMLECLADLRERLDGQLVIRRGPPERELAGAGPRELGAAELHFSADSGPFARRRIERVTAARSASSRFAPTRACTPWTTSTRVRTQAGKPYTVFSPFHRTWLAGAAPRGDRARRARSARCRAACGWGGSRRLGSLGLEQEVREPLPGGEAAGRERLAAFLRVGVSDLRRRPRRAGRDRSSRLSPYLHFGCLSPREIEARLPGGEGAEAFRRQLCWRDFYHHVLLHFPRNARSEFQERYRGAIGWSRAERRFDAWREGRTGYPLVDAGMRQLRREGWMHNRARLVVGLVPDQGPRDRLALGRALVHAAADRRRRGQQQRQLAVDRVGGGRPAAVLPPPLQPDAAPGALRPGRATTCAATCPSCARCRTST